MCPVLACSGFFVFAELLPSRFRQLHWIRSWDSLPDRGAGERARASGNFPMVMGWGCFFLVLFFSFQSVRLTETERNTLLIGLFATFLPSFSREYFNALHSFLSL
jgi:hypothetical protein